MAAQAVIVGVGQLRNRPGLDGDFKPVEPARMMVHALDRAVADAGVPGLAAQADYVGTVAPLAWRYDDTPARVAELAGARPRIGFEPPAGGDSPVALLNEVANRIRAGETRIALLAGAEAMYGRRRARRDGIELDWPQPTGSRDVFGGQRPLANQLEARHGLNLPINMYPLFENALRAEAGRGIQAHQRFLGELMARYSEVAAGNPFSWFPEPRTAEEIRTVGEGNRWVCFPYPKLMNAIMDVDQAAACVVMSDTEADRLGIPPQRRVGFLGGAKAVDAWTPTERIDFVSSPAYAAAAREALDRARVAIADIERFDFYSCFPCAPQLALKALGLAWDDPRVPTVTGGLAHHGGPGNNYSMHALANMVELLRGEDAGVGLVSALGMTATKHAICVLATDPARVAAAEGTSTVLDLPPEVTHGPELVDAPEGGGRIETYTVEFDRGGRPQRGMLVIRLDDGRRSVAHCAPEPAVFARLLESEGVGLRGRVTPGAGGSPNRFALD